MRPIDFILGIVFMATLGTGVTLATTAMTAVEFWIARGCFVVGAISAMTAYLLWYQRNPVRGWGIKLTLALLTIAVVAIGGPASWYWVGVRELIAETGPRLEFGGITAEVKGSEIILTLHVNNTSEISATSHYLAGTVFLSNYENDNNNADVLKVVTEIETSLRHLTLRDNEEIQITRGMGLELPTPPIAKEDKELTESGGKKMYVILVAAYRKANQRAGTMWITEMCAQITKPFTGFKSCPTHNRYFLSDQKLNKLN